ncbi:hypothetical protein [Marinigracilibium pacificum]|uniref:Uncharacterized protein n=1 Tax=Marinigracilibium pacificum TaxID=2729599 RepID=A0A848IUW9_9BACT|nr:hypothetical protein [Marinigracilibium pacificum]NMM47021.1 hypothetical protein [Marinigracilibium pacificum]
MSKSDLHMSFNGLRVGNHYKVKNFGEVYIFEVVERIGELNYKCKDVVSLETFEFEDIIRYGIGKDFDLDEYKPFLN